MAKFIKARRMLRSELRPVEQAIRTIREDRQRLAQLHRKLKRDEERHLRTARQIKVALAALQQVDPLKTATAEKQLGLWSNLANNGSGEGTDKTNTAANRLARTIARRHQPKERRALLRLAGLLQGGLARLRSGRDRKPVGMVTVSFNPHSKRDVQRVLELAGVYAQREQRQSQKSEANQKQSAGRGAKNESNFGR